MWRWLGRNLSTLLLAFLLALVVWVSAVISTDPTVEADFPAPVELEVFGQDPAFMQVERIPSTVQLTLKAPQSIWVNLNQDTVRAWVDLSGIVGGQYEIPVRIQIDLSPVQVVKVDPPVIKVNLEPLVTRMFPIIINVTGDPALGYRKGAVQVNPTNVTVSGPSSLAEQVVDVRVSMDVSNVNDTVRNTIPVQPVDQNGKPVAGLSVTPSTVELIQVVSLLGGYRNVVVKVVTTGQVAQGYWLTNVSVTPPNVTVFSTNPRLVNELPGFVETNPLDLTDLSDDIDIRATLNLPEGVTLAGEGSVLVRLSIAALEGSLPITLPLEIVGLSPEYRAKLSPDTVDLLLTGPLPLLNNLTPGGIRVSVNLSGLEPDVHQVPPKVDLLPPQISVASMIPENVEVTIEIAPPETTSPAGQGSPTPSPTTPTP